MLKFSSFKKINLVDNDVNLNSLINLLNLHNN